MSRLGIIANGLIAQLAKIRNLLSNESREEFDYKIESKVFRENAESIEHNTDYGIQFTEADIKEAIVDNIKNIVKTDDKMFKIKCLDGSIEINGNKEKYQASGEIKIEDYGKAIQKVREEEENESTQLKIDLNNTEEVWYRVTRDGDNSYKLYLKYMQCTNNGCKYFNDTWKFNIEHK